MAKDEADEAGEKPTDLTALSYDEWLRYIFDRPCDETSPGGADGEPWYWNVAIPVCVEDPLTLVRYVDRMCRDFAAIAQQYSLQQVNHGVWFLLSGGFVSFVDYLLDARLPLGPRVTCIASMEIVFSGFLAHSTDPVLEGCFYMWWDLLKVRENHQSDDARQIRQAMFEVLVRTLALDDARCQHCALHGLGHIDHPDRATVVQGWMDTHRTELDPEAIVWIEQCRDGRVM